MNNLANQFTEVAKENSNKTAIFWGGDEFSFDHAH